MGFDFRDIPTHEMLIQVSKNIPELDVSAVESFIWFLRTASDVQDHLNDFYQKKGTSKARLRVLILLNKGNLGMSPSELADRSGVTRGTITGLLDGLERDKYIKRVLDLADRRRNTITITEHGRNHLKEVLPMNFLRISKLMEEISEEERQMFLKTVKKIHDAIPAMEMK